jgi:hypothetical protein
MISATVDELTHLNRITPPPRSPALRLWIGQA